MAQEADGYFGKNRIQSKKYNWQVISYRNSDIYYTYGNKSLAEMAGNYAEENLISLTETIGYTPFNKLRIIVYGNIQEHQEANIAINQTELLNNNKGTFVKNRIEIVFKGSQTVFENDLKEGISGALINTMLFGGSFKEIIQSAYFLSLPEWFVSGASRYTALGWNLEMDNYIRSLALNNKLEKPEKYSGENATLIGQSIWNYFVIQYGQLEMQMLLNYLKVAKNYKLAFESTTGFGYDEFINQWKDYYKINSTPIDFTDNPNLPVLNKNKEQIISIDAVAGEEAIWITKANNRYKAKQANPENPKPTTILKGGHLVFNRQQESILPIIRYSEKGEKGILTTTKKGFAVRIFYTEKDKKGKTYPINGIRNISDFSFSPDGRSIIIAGSNSTNSDIYQYFFQSNKLIQITNLPGDEINPSFLEGTSTIVFASNAGIDSSSGLSHFQIFTMDLQSKTIDQAFQISGNCFSPKVDSENIYFLNDYAGIQNIYSFNRMDSGFYRQSNNLYNITQFELVNNNQFLIKTSYLGKDLISIIPGKPLRVNSENHLPQTNRAKHLISTQPRISTTAVKEIHSDIDNNKLAQERQNNIDINNYRFESEKQFGNSELIRKKLNAKIFFKGPVDYNSPFSIEQINSTFLIDPLRGLGLYLDAGMTDVLENHKITIGIFGLTNLKSSSLFGEYQLLKYRTDFGIRYDRKTIYAVTNSIVERYALNKFKFNIAYPLDISKRIEISPFLATTSYNPMDINFSIADTIQTNTFYYGIRESFMMDNTKSFGLNSRKGLRGIIFMENYFSNQPLKNFGKLGIDIRHYLPIFKRVTLATRGYYGAFFGKAPKNFLAGGMNNWLFNRTNFAGNNDPLNLQFGKDNSDLLFIEYITPLRGFNYNQQFGNKTFVINAELRIPFVELLYPREISSVFLKNFEVVGFSDLGAAWSGDGLFSNNNTLNTVIINDPTSPLSAVVNNYKKPYLWGYGFGLRSMLLGYFVKMDIAWGVLDRQVQDAKYYFTFGYDF
mgnify:CR=1 FL=1